MKAVSFIKSRFYGIFRFLIFPDFLRKKDLHCHSIQREILLKTLLFENKVFYIFALLQIINRFTKLKTNPNFEYSLGGVPPPNFPLSFSTIIVFFDPP